ncbi:hypothetical protein [Burkholderia sp. S171]|uniref:hypothetical protein n=1 Tax=Burkholderia sp. S171 TaxID=1641860 RepID=UPI00131CDE06|nr:hypothetical protein [Burkholderia sp. S171]
MTTTTEQTLHYAALGYISQRQGEHLDHDRLLLIDRCVSHLIETKNVSQRVAEIATLQAYGEHDSKACKAYVDMSLTTSHSIFIRDVRTGRLRVFSVGELIDLVKTPALASLPVPSTRHLLANGITETPLSQ